jgi:hypothetical protein
MNHPEHQTLELETAPCTRYYLAAKRSSLTASDWAAFVSRSEPIGECARKFRLPPAAPR